ncbi:LysR family transcriptional regulator [Pseudovibrio ascidiaceicola]|uniref:LysR family transcriptional regulator n=1 Tax=Pseudovibrio ascidiaceicola TaxID=285279 RepID=UPI000D68D022|nr:LysR family transcriptional regulator [Pseudovibrio ascidiaceicola]
MPSLDQLKMFIAAAETGSFSAAGRVLGKGQSAVSTAIVNLEVDLGFELFDRATRKPQLTQDGERMLTHARAVLMQLDNMTSAASSIFAGDEVSVRVMLDDALMLPSLSNILIEFGTKFPATRIDLMSDVSPEIPGMVAQGSADIGLMFSGGMVQKGVEQVFIGNLPFVSVSAPDYPLSKLTTVSANELLSHRQLLLRSPQGSVLDQFPVLSTQVWYATSFHTIRQLVLQGVGWAYLPEHLVSPSIASGHLARVNLRFEHKLWSPPVECIKLKHTRMGPATSWLYESIKNVLS